VKEDPSAGGLSTRVVYDLRKEKISRKRDLGRCLHLQGKGIHAEKLGKYSHGKGGKDLRKTYQEVVVHE